TPSIQTTEIANRCNIPHTNHPPRRRLRAAKQSVHTEREHFRAQAIQLAEHRTQELAQLQEGQRLRQATFPHPSTVRLQNLTDPTETRIKTEGSNGRALQEVFCRSFALKPLFLSLILIDFTYGLVICDLGGRAGYVLAEQAR